MQRGKIGTSDEVIWAAYRTINGSVGPLIEEVLRKPQVGSEQYVALQGVLASVVELHGSLVQATNQGGADHYDIAGDGGGAGEGGVGAMATDEMAKPAPTPADGAAAAMDGGEGMDTSDSKAPAWIEKANDAGSGAWGHHRWGRKEAKSLKLNDGSTAGRAQKEGEEDGVTLDAEEAEEQRRQHIRQMQLHNLQARREEIYGLARELAVAIDQAKLDALTAEQLEEWAKEHLHDGQL